MPNDSLKPIILLLTIAILLFGVACGGAAETELVTVEADTLTEPEQVEEPTDTPKPTDTAEPTDTPKPTETVTAKSSHTPEPAITLTPIVTEVPIPKSDNIIEIIPVVDAPMAYVLALQGMDMLNGPGFNYDPVGVVFEKQIIQVTGQSQDGEWWRVLCPEGTVGNCWVTANPSLTYPTDAPSLEAMLPDPASLEMVNKVVVPSPDGRWLATAAWSDNVMIINHIGLFYTTLTITSGTTSWTPIAEWRHVASSFAQPRIIQWSNDSRYLYYTEIPNLDGCYYFINGSNFVSLDVTNGSTAEILPKYTTNNLALSPDGAFLVYINGIQTALVIRTMDSGQEQHIALAEAGDYAQTGEIFWSADGSTAVLTVIHDSCLFAETTNSSIIRINTDTMTAIPLIDNDNRLFRTLGWPDPKQNKIRLIDKDGNIWWLAIDSGELIAE